MTCSLLDTLKSDVPEFHRDRLRIIDETDFGNVRKKVKRDFEERGLEVTDAFLDEGILALKHYYAIAVLDPLNMHAVSARVDPFWHAHILFTQDYAAFCDRYVGGFLQHDPLDHDDTQKVAFVGELYRYTNECYERFFTYVNWSFLPDAQAEASLVCTHMDIGYDRQVYERALLPALPGFQSANLSFG